MKVLLISPLIQECNYVGEYSSTWPQLGLASIASMLENNRHQVKILERRLLAGPTYPKTQEKIDSVDKGTLRNIEDFKPEVIGLTSTTPTIMDAYRTARLVKTNYPRLPIVIGGRHATTEPFYTLQQCSEIDIVCRGEGEITMLELAEGLDWSKIKGIIFRGKGKKFVVNPSRPVIENLDELPYPAWHLLDQDYYFKPNISVMRGDYMRTATLMTTRGCPYRCAFCQSPELLDIHGNKYIRYHSVDRVISEIEYLIDRFKVSGISFNDDLFSVKKDRVFQICSRIIEKGINKKIKFTVNLRSDRVDREMLSVLREAGCIHVIFGCESGSDETLKRMNKSLSVSKNAEAIKMTKKHGLTAEANIIIGTPGEIPEDFLKTIKFLKRSRPDKIFISKFYPIPGTGFYKDLLEKGVIKTPSNWDDLNTLYVETDNFTFANMNPSTFVKLRNKLNREIVLRTNYSYIIRKNFSKNVMLVLNQMLKMFFYVMFYCLPLSIQMGIKRAVGKMGFNLRYSLRK